MTNPPLNLALDDDGKPEIFRSFQGEGPMAGRVRTFIRLSGCNLHCRWCDTPYTWNWQGTDYEHVDGRKFSPRDEMEKSGVAEAAETVLSFGAPGVVITGGEPMMQPRGVAALGSALKAAQPGIRIEIETNGTLAPGAELLELVDLFMVSPKLAFSGNAPDAAVRGVENYREIEAAQFKFVAACKDDVEEAAALVSDIEKHRVWIMPEGRTPEELDRHLAAIADPVLEHGFNLADRQHIRLFGDTRGT